MFPMPDDAPLASLSDEDRKRLLEEYAPSPIHTGAVTRGTQGFAPLPMPRGALMPDRPALTSARAPSDDEAFADFARAQSRDETLSGLSHVGSLLDGFARDYVGLGPNRNVTGKPTRSATEAFLERRGVLQQEANRKRQQELDAVNLDKTRAETTKAQASAAATEADAKREALLADPKSAESAALRETATALLVDQYGKPTIRPEKLAGMSGVQIREALKFGTSRLNADAQAFIGQQRANNDQRFNELTAALRAEGIKSAETIAQMMIDSREGEGAKNRALEAELAKMRAEVEAAKSERERGVKEGDKVAADTKDIAEAFDKAGGPNFYAKYGEVKDMLAKYKTDIPGFGKVDGYKPDILVSDDALTVRQGIGQMLAEYRKGITGAGMSDAERKEYGSITGLIQSNNERSVRQGVERLRRAMDARFQALGGGFRPEAVRTYAQRVPAFGAALAGSPVDPEAQNDAAPTPARPPRTPMPSGDLDGSPPTQKPAPKAAAPAAAPREISIKGMKAGDLKEAVKEGETVHVKELNKTYKKVNGKLYPVGG